MLCGWRCPGGLWAPKQHLGEVVSAASILRACLLSTNPPLVEVKSHNFCFNHAFVGLDVVAHHQAAVAMIDGQCGEGAAFLVCQERALPLLLWDLVLLGGGMLGHNSLGHEMKQEGLLMQVFFLPFYFIFLPLGEALNPLPALMVPAPRAEPETLQPDGDK